MSKEIKDKSIHYILETLNLLIENEKVLLKRIKKLEDKINDLGRNIIGDDFDDDKDDRTIN